MKIYNSMGFGVNSVAQHLLLLDQGVDFESVFVHHGCDWPETYQYAAGFQWWLKKNGYKPVTILRPTMNTVEKIKFNNLYDYFYFKKIFPITNGGPNKQGNICTNRFKIDVFDKYVETPCFVNIGFDYGEAHRARINNDKGKENRFPLIEHEIDREGCKKIIRDHGLPVPVKSGCYICPNQSVTQYKELRHRHPDLFCKAEQLEKRYIERRKKEGKKPIYILQKAPLKIAIEEDQRFLWKKYEYPPCQCGL